MADIQTTLALGIDSSASAAGAQVHVQSINAIKAANLGAVPSFDAVTAATQRLTGQQALIEHAYAGAVGASDMLADATYRATLATTEQQAAFDALIGPANAAALAEQRLAESEGAAAAGAEAVTVASGPMIAANTEAAASFTLGGVGASYMARTMDMAALSMLGVTGMAGRAGAAMAVFGAGSSGAAVELAAVVAVVAALAYGYEHFLTFTDPLIASVTAISAALTKQASAGHTAEENYLQLTERINDLKTTQDTGSLSLKDWALATVDAGAKVLGFSTNLAQNSMAQEANTLATFLGTQVGLAHADALLEEAENSNKLASQLDSLAQAHVLTGQALTLTESMYKANAAAIANLGVVTGEDNVQNAIYIALLGARKTLYDALHEGERQRITDMQAVGAAQSALQIATDNANHNALQAAKDQYTATLAADAATASLARSQLGANVAAINATQAAKDLTAALKLHSDIVAIATTAYTAYLAKLDAAAAVNHTVTDAQQALNVAILQSQGQFGAAADAQQKYQEQAALRSIASVKNLTDEGLGVGALILMLVQAKYAVLDLVAAHAQQKQATDDIASATAALAIAQAKASGDSVLATQLEVAEKNRALEVTVALDVAQKKWGDDSAAVGAQLLALGEQTNALDAATTKTTQHAQQGYSNLASGMRSDFDTLFEGIATQGLSAFTTFFDNVEKLFVKLLADMAAQAVEKSFLTPLLGQLTGVTAAAGPNNVGGTGLPLSQVANADVGQSGGLTPLAVIGVGTAIVGVVASIIGQADALATARIAYQNNVALFDASLTQFVTTFGQVATAVGQAVTQSFSQVASEADKAIQLAVTSPDLKAIGFTGAADQNLIDTEGLQGLQYEIGSLQRLAAGLGAGSAADALNSLVTQLQSLVPAAQLAAKAIGTQFLQSIQDAYTGSLPGGQNLLTLQGYGTQEQTAIASATSGLSTGAISGSDFNTAVGLATQTFTNQWQSFLTSLNLSDLQTILPQLTGDQSTYAQSLIATDQATQNATDAAAASAAAITAAATSLKSMQDFLVTMYQTVASQSSDAETIKYNNLAALGIQQQQQKAAAQALLDAGTISVTMFDTYIAALQNGWTLATNSVDGTINGMTQSAYALAAAAQTLSDNASQLTQQFNVFGTTLADQASTLRTLYGFTGQSDDQIRGQYVSEQNGVELTPAQKALDDNIASYFATENQYLQSLTASTTSPAASATSPAPSLTTAATATYGPTAPIVNTPAINVTVMVTQDEYTDAQAGAKKFITAVDAALYRRAALVGESLGQQP